MNIIGLSKDRVYLDEELSLEVWDKRHLKRGTSAQGQLV